MQTYDDLDILALQWLALCFVAFWLIAWIGSRHETRKRRQVLPPPHPFSIRDRTRHDRYYRITPTDRTVK